MYIQILKSFMAGYVRISIEGYFIERLINLCIKNNILLWNSKRKKATLLETNLSIKDFKEIIKYVKQTKCKLKIKQKKGLPFIFHKYKKRKIFFVFLILIMLGIISLSNFVWNLEITGNTSISTEEIQETLKNEGLSVGILKSKVNTKEIANKMRLLRNDLAWIGIEIKGTNAIVKIVEADKKPDIIDEDDYCNIVATKPGIIVKVNAVNGMPLVKEGDVVKENTPLIGGWIEGKYTGINYVHAIGSVTAKVWYTQNEKIELKQVISNKTERKENKYSVKINNFQINFYKTLSNFQKYDTIDVVKKIKLFSNFYLPIELVQKTNYELEEKEKIYTRRGSKTDSRRKC